MIISPSPPPPVEFHFDSASTSPFISAPGSPQPFGNLYYSAPTSPTRISTFYTDQFDHFPSSAACDSPTVISKAKDDHDDEEDDFEFNFAGQLDKPSFSVSAEELFHGGQIKPSSSKLQFVEQMMVGDCEKSDEIEKQGRETEQPIYEKKEGERKYRGSRSLPRFRISDMLLENGNEKTSKWGRLKDILLFRSASEGRVMGKQYPLKKYELLKKVSEEEVKVSSFRSSESVKRVPAAMMSAHEIHYTANRAASEEMKRRTFLPYKQTLLGGCLGFNPAVHDHRQSGTFGLSTRG